MVSARGASVVIAVEPDAARAERAWAFGASVVLDGSLRREELRRCVLEATSGRGAEYVLEFSGMPEAVENGLELLRFGGRMVMAGSTFPSRAVALPAEQVVRRMLQLTGVYNYQPEDLAAALEFLASEVERFPFSSLVGREFSLDEVQVAFEYAETVRPPRVAIVPAGI